MWYNKVSIKQSIINKYCDTIGENTIKHEIISELKANQLKGAYDYLVVNRE